MPSRCKDCSVAVDLALHWRHCEGKKKSCRCYCRDSCDQTNTNGQRCRNKATETVPRFDDFRGGNWRFCSLHANQYADSIAAKYPEVVWLLERRLSTHA